MTTIINKIKAQLYRIWHEEDGMGTIEIVIIIAVLVGIAFLFNTFANDFFNEITTSIRQNSQINKLFR